jgi:diacylglycerol kinase (ATP)
MAGNRAEHRDVQREERERQPLNYLAPSSPERVAFDVRLVLRSFTFAFAGIMFMVRTQRNAQVHLFITSIVIVAGVFFNVSVGEWLALVLSITLVLALEAINTALEAVVDLASPQIHPLAKRAKDSAAGAVLIGAIGAAIVGLTVFLPRIVALIWTLFA